MADDIDLGPKLYCAGTDDEPCDTSWRTIAGVDCWLCGQPGVLGRFSAPPAGWPRTTCAPVAVEPRAS